MKRFVGTLFGLLYAVGYAFLTFIVSIIIEGPHGSFLWTAAFLITYFYGVFFVAAGFFVADLQPRWARSGLTILLLLNSVATLVLFFGTLGRDEWTDMADLWNQSPAVFVLMWIIHFLPVAVLWTISLRRFVIDRSETRVNDELRFRPRRSRIDAD